MPHEEPKITINGHDLSSAQVMTIRVAIENFAACLIDSLGTDPHGKAMTKLYRERINEIRGLMFTVTQFVVRFHVGPCAGELRAFPSDPGERIVVPW